MTNSAKNRNKLQSSSLIITSSCLLTGLLLNSCSTEPVAAPIQSEQMPEAQLMAATSKNVPWIKAGNQWTFLDSSSDFYGERHVEIDSTKTVSDTLYFFVTRRDTGIQTLQSYSGADSTIPLLKTDHQIYLIHSDSVYVYYESKWIRNRGGFFEYNPVADTEYTIRSSNVGTHSSSTYERHYKISTTTTSARYNDSIVDIVRVSELTSLEICRSSGSACGKPDFFDSDASEFVWVSGIGCTKSEKRTLNGQTWEILSRSKLQRFNGSLISDTFF